MAIRNQKVDVVMLMGSGELTEYAWEYFCTLSSFL